MNIEMLPPAFNLGGLEGADLIGTILRKAIFEGVTMLNVDFRDADLSGSTFYLTGNTLFVCECKFTKCHILEWKF